MRQGDAARLAYAVLSATVKIVTPLSVGRRRYSPAPHVSHYVHAAFRDAQAEAKRGGTTIQIIPRYSAEAYCPFPWGVDHALDASCFLCPVRCYVLP